MRGIGLGCDGFWIWGGCLQSPTPQDQASQKSNQNAAMVHKVLLIFEHLLALSSC